MVLMMVLIVVVVIGLGRTIRVVLTREVGTVAIVAIITRVILLTESTCVSVSFISSFHMLLFRFFSSVSHMV